MTLKVLTYIDDIRISARNAQEHNERLAAVLERARKEILNLI